MMNSEFKARDEEPQVRFDRGAELSEDHMSLKDWENNAMEEDWDADGDALFAQGKGRVQELGDIYSTGETWNAESE